jgi:hypothetical protein
MRVSKEPSIAFSVHCLHEGRIVCPLAEGRELLLAVSALSTCNLETDDYSVSLLELCDVLADAVYFSAEFVAKYVSLLQS